MHSIALTNPLFMITNPEVKKEAKKASKDESFNEKELVARAQQKDVQAYTELMAHYQSRIYALVYNMTSNKEDTEDLVQEVFIKAYAALEKFQGKSSFYTWVYRIAVNRSINFLKKRKKRMALSLNEVDHGVERDELYIEMSSKKSPFRDAHLSEMQIKINESLQTLSEKHRAVVVMHDIQGMPHDQIAKIIGVSSGTVRSRLFYARQRLQAELTEYAP